MYCAALFTVPRLYSKVERVLFLHRTGRTVATRRDHGCRPSLEEIMQTGNLPRVAAALGAVALAVLMTGPSFAQDHTYYPSSRRLNDNGSVDEPGPAASAQPIHVASAHHRGHLVNQAGYTPAPAWSINFPGQYFPGVRRASDNGSVYEPGPGR